MRKPESKSAHLKESICKSLQVVSSGLHRTQQNAFFPGAHLSVSSACHSNVTLFQFSALCSHRLMAGICFKPTLIHLPNHHLLARCGSGRTWMGAWTREQVFQPYGCWRVLFDSPQTRTCLRGQRLAMVGDSTSRFMFWCLAYLLDGRTDESGEKGVTGQKNGDF